MATQRYISTSFWDDSWVHKLDPSEKLLFLYLMTNPLTNIAGIYKLSIERMVYDTGFNENTVKHILEKFNKAGKVITKDEFIILPTWPKHQKTSSPKIKSGIDTILSTIPKEILFTAKKSNYLYPIDTLLKGYAYSSNYLDLNSDLNSDLDLNPHTPYSENPIHSQEITEDTFLPIQDFHPCTHAELWNSLGLPKFTRTRLNISPADLETCRRGTEGRTLQEIQEAMRNYALVQCDQETYRAPFPYTTLINFLAKGVEIYSSLEPFKKRKKDEPEMTEERALEIARSLN